MERLAKSMTLVTFICLHFLTGGSSSFASSFHLETCTGTGARLSIQIQLMELILQVSLQLIADLYHYTGIQACRVSANHPMVNLQHIGGRNW